jgi:hypothetical protein
MNIQYLFHHAFDLGKAMADLYSTKILVRSNGMYNSRLLYSNS